MTSHEIIVTATGAVLTVGSPIAYRWLRVDGFIALITFFIGLTLIVQGHL